MTSQKRKWLRSNIIFDNNSNNNQNNSNHSFSSTTATVLTAANINVIVSPIQILTTNPLVESWGHFPAEKKRLMNLLVESKTPVILISGDVHHAEIARISKEEDEVRYNNANNNFINNDKKKNNDDHDYDSGLVEITSSGMTHSCKGAFWGSLCGPILDTFHKHRWKDMTCRRPFSLNNNFYNHGGDSSEQQYDERSNDYNLEEEPCYYTDLNFGNIHIDWNNINNNINDDDDRNKKNLDDYDIINDEKCDYTDEDRLSKFYDKKECVLLKGKDKSSHGSTNNNNESSKNHVLITVNIHDRKGNIVLSTHKKSLSWYTPPKTMTRSSSKTTIKVPPLGGQLFVSDTTSVALYFSLSTVLSVTSVLVVIVLIISIRKTRCIREQWK